MVCLLCLAVVCKIGSDIMAGTHLYVSFSTLNDQGSVWCYEVGFIFVYYFTVYCSNESYVNVTALFVKA